MSTQRNRQLHQRRVGDTRTALSATLQQKDSDGVLQAVDLSSASVTFTMRPASGGAAKVNAAAASIIDATAGRVDYNFEAADVDTAGLFFASFEVTIAGKTDTFPVVGESLAVLIHS